MPLPLLGSVSNILPSVANIDALEDSIEVLTAGFVAATQASAAFYNTAIASNIELQSMVRRSATVLAAQTDFFDQAGSSITDVSTKYDILSGKLKAIQREIEIETRDIVGATDATTNAVFDDIISNFGQLRGQTKNFANDIDAVAPLVVNLTSALKTFEIPDFQIPQEIRSLLQGDVNNPDSILANRLRDLGLTKEVVQEAQATGEWLDLLMEKTETFSAVNIVGAQSLTNSFSVIQGLWQQFTRDLGSGPTEGLEKGLAAFVTSLASPNIAQALTDFATSFGTPISEALEEAGLKFGLLFENLNTGNNLAVLGEQIGKFIAEIIRLGTFAGQVIVGVIDVAGTVLGVLAQISSNIQRILTLNPKIEITTGASVEKSNEQLSALDKFLRSFSKGEFKTKVLLDVPNPAEYQKLLNKFQDDLNKSPLQALLDLDFSLALKAILNLKRSNELKEIENVAKNVAESFSSEFVNNAKIIEDLKINAPKVGAIDVSNLRNFSADLSNTLSSEVSRLSKEVPWSNISVEGKKQIEDALNSISNSSDLQKASENIANLVTNNLTNIDIKDFVNKLDLIKQAYAASVTEYDALLADATAGNYLNEVSEDLKSLQNTQLGYKQAIEEVIYSSNSQVVAQQNLIQQLEATGESTESAKAKLVELKKAAIESQGALSSAMDPTRVGQALNKVLTDLNSNVAAFGNTMAGKVDQDFENLIKSIQAAQQIGAKSYKDLSIIAENAASSDLVSIEARQSALKVLNSLLVAEGDAKKGLIDLDNKIIASQLQSGKLSKERADLASSDNAIRLLELDLETKKAQLSASQRVNQAGLTQELNAQRAAAEAKYSTTVKQLQLQYAAGTLSEKSFATEVGAAKVAQDKALTKISELNSARSLGTEGERKLKAEIDSLAVTKTIEQSKQIELKVTEKLAEFEEARLISGAKNAKGLSEQRAELEKLLAAGTIDLFDKNTEDLSIQVQENLAKQNDLEDELAIKKQAYSASDSASKAFSIGLLKEILNLETQLTDLSGAQAAAQLALNNQTTQALIDRANQTRNLISNELSANQQVNDSVKAYNDAIKAGIQLQEQLKQTALDTANQMGNIKLANIDFDTDLVTQAIDLQNQLSTAQGSEKAYLEERLSIISEATGIENANATSLIDLINQKADLEIKNNEYNYNQKLAQAKLALDSANSEISLLATKLEYEQSILDVKKNALLAERNALVERSKLNGYLTEEEKSRLKTIELDLKVNTNTSKANAETIGKLETQRSLQTDIYNGKLATAKGEKDHADNVVNTNAKLDAQGAKQQENGKPRPKPKPEPKPDEDPERPGIQKTSGTKGKISQDSYTVRSEEPKTPEAKYYSRAAKNISERFFGNELQGSSAAVSSRGPGANNLKMLQYLKALSEIPEYYVTGSVNQQTTASAAGNFNSLVSKERYDIRNTFESLGKTLVDRLKEIQAGPYSNKNLVVREQYFRSRNNFINEDIASSDALIRNQGLSTRLTDLKAELATLLVNETRGSRNDNAMAEIRSKIDETTKELKTIASYAVLSYQLQQSATDLQSLGSQRQTSETVNSINQIASDLIDFYAAEAENKEIITLGEQLEALRKNPDATVGQILEVANAIKVATDKTAANTSKNETYVNILDAIKQGGFFGADYKDAPGLVTKDLIYSGFKFSNANVETNNSAPKVDLEEKISEIKIPVTEKTVPKDLILPEIIQELPKAPGIAVGGSSKPEEPVKPSEPKVTKKKSTGLQSVNGVSSLNVRPTNIINNYYPNQSGSVSSTLRSSGL
jgi:hypothetical protein